MTEQIPVRRIEPNQRFTIGMIAGFITAMRDLFYARDMILQLFRKDFFAGYKKSFIGSAWIILTPVAGIVSWVILHRANIIRPGAVGVPYPAYVLVGTLLWGFFMNVTSACMNAMANSRHLLLWVRFPHEAVFAVQLLLQAVHFAVSFCVTMLLLIVFNITPPWHAVFFPLVLLPLVFLALSIGILTSILSVISYDLRKVVMGLFGLILFITPVIYSADVVSQAWLQKMIYLNPLTYLVCSARDILLYGRLYEGQGFLYSACISVALFFLSWRIFYVAEDKIIERMI